MQNENKSKPKLAFVDHSFHKKTGSANFLRNILKEKFEVIDFWDESWNGGKQVNILELEKYDYIFYFQVINKIQDLFKLKSKIIWAPMYDGQRLDYMYWKLLSTSNIKILSFSKKIENQCKKYKIQTLSTKKYINPEKFTEKIDTNGKNIFFWYRGDVKFNEIKKIIKPSEVTKLIYFSNPDPNKSSENISQEDINRYKITIIESNFLNQEEYLKHLYRTNIFIAPRKQEGIGMSFLEAMALGHAVIAYDEATMNEYIINGKNGYLYNEKTDEIKLSDSQQIINNNMIERYENYSGWKKDEKKILEFVFEKNDIKIKYLQYLIMKLLYEIIETFKKLK